MKTQTIIQLIIAAQLFAAGVFYGDQRAFSDKKVNLYLITLSIIFFGWLWAIGITILTIAGFIHHRIFRPLHLPFIWKHVILKKPVEGFDLKRHKATMPKIAKMHPKWYNVSDRIFIALVNWIDRNYAQNNIIKMK